VHPSLANPRRAAAILAAFALCCALSPSLADALPPAARAQADTTSQPPVPPVPPAPAAIDTTARPAAPAPAAPAVSTPAPAAAAPTGRSSKPPKAPKPPKVKKVKPPGKPYVERRAEDGVYAAGANWLSLRFGYAKRSEDFSGQGLVGYGMGWQRMLTRRWAFATGAGHDVVGHFGSQLDIAVPFTGEFQRHFAWKSAVRPFLGFGGGYYLRKQYRTGADYHTTTTGGAHVTIGLLSPVTDRHVIGFETRAAFLKGAKGVVDPTFGTGVGTETLWSAKVSWALVY
jgi:hypothetical protein